ncbi:GerMN domain-containing protein [Kribbella sp. NPDC050124]|uniref:GerMN domain-containing protein n=1 Tax=Kribbella sp. NPDC050124 TaxID=3364114 RepID=UPI00378A71F5
MRRLAGVVAVALLLVGCGVPLQSEPVPIEAESIPSRLQTPDTPTSVATAARTAVQVVYVRNDRLIKVAREVSGSRVLDGVIQALRTGPTGPEQADGITTALPPGLALTVVAIQGTRVVLELSGETDGRSATQNVLAVGQIVLSVTALQSVDEVTFSRAGKPVEALLADGAVTTQPLTAEDYEALRVP